MFTIACIPAYNEETNVAKTVRNVGKFVNQVIICDDGSTDGTEKTIKDLQNNIDFNLKYIFQKNSGPGIARNNGVKNAQGELIIFTDSDCEAEKNWYSD